MKINYTCWQNEGNRLCTDGKHTYHQWNIYHGDKCNFCNTKRWFKTKTCPFCEKTKEPNYCECKRCEKCGKIIN